MCRGVLGAKERPQAMEVACDWSTGRADPGWMDGSAEDLQG